MFLFKMLFLFSLKLNYVGMDSYLNKKWFLYETTTGGVPVGTQHEISACSNKDKTKHFDIQHGPLNIASYRVSQ